MVEIGNEFIEELEADDAAGRNLGIGGGSISGDQVTGFAAGAPSFVATVGAPVAAAGGFGRGMRAVVRLTGRCWGGSVFFKVFDFQNRGARGMGDNEDLPIFRPGKSQRIAFEPIIDHGVQAPGVPDPQMAFHRPRGDESPVVRKGAGADDLAMGFSRGDLTLRGDVP
jgi:hypothetical protein